MTRQYRRQTYHFGLWAEWVCRLRLRLHGYQIRATRLRTAAGEIDIIASRGAIVAIIEVKARRDSKTAAAALTERQRTRIERATHFVLAQRPELMGKIIRFDLMLVTPWCWPRHIENAWLANN
jgi:putative endonuclease